MPLEKQRALTDYPKALRLALGMHQALARLGAQMNEVHVSVAEDVVSVEYLGATFPLGTLGYSGEEFARFWGAAAARWNDRSVPRRERRAVWREFKQELGEEGLGKLVALVTSIHRDYKSKEEVLKDFDANKDFTINDPVSKWDGKLVNKEQLKSGDAVTFRFAKLKRVFTHKVP